MLKFEQLIPPGYCFSCQGCCRFAEKKSIWLPHLLEEERKHLGEIPVVSDPVQNNFICGFLNTGNNKCRIYDQRPFECRLYPFLINRSAERIFIGLDTNCAFVKENLKKEDFRKRLLAQVGFIQEESFRVVLRDNPRLAQTYEDILNLAEINV